jgi:hypothetical protein
LRGGEGFASLRAAWGAPRMTEPAADTPASMDALPRHTTPAWEVELLISGVAVFAMLQLPGLLDDAFFALRPRFGADWTEPLLLLYVYSKSAAVILAATFVVHLLLRARWIALVGLLSVYPGGIDWSRLRLGPVGREIEQRRMGSFDDAIERADNLSTTVFAVGVSLASLLIWFTLLASVILSLSLALGSTGVSNPTLSCIAAIVLPFAFAQMADRKLGHRLHPGSLPWRLVNGTIRLYARLGFGVGRNVAMAVLTSNGGQRRVFAMTFSIMLLAIGSVFASYYAMRAPDTIGSFALFPKPSEAAPGIASAHYDDTRNPARDHVVPYIQSAVITGPYVRLVVPYEPARDGAAMLRACPTVAALRATARADAALACLQRLYALHLDGQPLAQPYDIGSDPRTDRPALIAMIDVRKLGTGRHELQLARAPSVEDPHPVAATTDRIAFWR